jgi:hypothetical protein
VDIASLGRNFWKAIKMGGRQLLTMAFCALVLIAAFIALPSTAKAESWTEWFWGGNFKSYSECVDYYTKNNAAAWWHSPEDICKSLAAAQDEKRREHAEMTRTLVLSCRAASVSDAQFAACVALATAR